MARVEFGGLPADMRDDTLYGGAGEDRFEAGSGDDFIDGGDGVDAVAFLRSLVNYSVGFVDGALVVQDAFDVEGADRIVNVERAELLG